MASPSITNARERSTGARWLVLVGVVIASAGLVFGAARHGLAEHWAASSDTSQWLRAAELEPSNPEIWYLLGRYRQFAFENGDLRLAISYYKRALALNPRSVRYWADLASAYETAGDLGQAERAFREAQQAYPISGDVAFRFGNFLLRQGRVDEAFEQMHRAVSADQRLTSLVMPLCWRSTRDIDRILSIVLPAKPDAYWGALQFLVDSNEPDAAMAVWKRLTASEPSFPLPQAFPLLDMLIRSGYAENARTVWTQALSAAGITAEPAASGSLIWDGSFERDLLNGGLAWRFEPVAGAAMDLDEETFHFGRRSLHVVFDGTVNVNFQNVWQYVVVEPNTHYRFSAYLRTQELTTDSGIRFEIDDVSHPANAPQFKPMPSQLTPNVVGTQPWALDETEFLTGLETRLLRVSLRRTPSDKFGNKIGGAVWVDDVSLARTLAASPAE
jgi:hypothetical protein